MQFIQSKNSLATFRNESIKDDHIDGLIDLALTDDHSPR
jgi:hypothetical protein